MTLHFAVCMLLRKAVNIVTSSALLETDILSFTSNNYKICLLGDFNAHTNNGLDFTYVDDNIQQTLNIENVIDDTLGICPLEQLGFPKERHNSDL